MIRTISDSDIKAINTMGLEYDSKFLNHYCLENYVNNPSYLILVSEDKQLNGFIICTKFDNHIDVELLYVDKMFRNNNIGTSLLKEIEKSGKEFLLEVSVENIPALNLYKKMGYEIINTRKGYYTGIDALVMRKEL